MAEIASNFLILSQLLLFLTLLEKNWGSARVPNFGCLGAKKMVGCRGKAELTCFLARLPHSQRCFTMKELLPLIFERNLADRAFPFTPTSSHKSPALSQFFAVASC
jgi:hypothetical protein